MLSLALFALSACGAQPTSQESEDDETTAEESWAAYALDPNDTDAWMRAEPGRYSGDNYDEEILKGQLEAWPEGLSAEEYFARLMALAAEDFRPYQQYLDDIEVVFSDITERPDGLNVEGETAEETSLHVQVLLDASGSMAGRLDGQTKMSLAKEAIKEFVSELPEGAQVSLRVYGHKGSNQPTGKAESCAKTEEVFALGVYDEEAFASALNAFQPTGYTPIALAIEEAGKDLLRASKDKNVKNVIYVVSDGEETCGGDPVAAAKQIQQYDIDAVINIIGFDIQASERAALEAIAQAGNGEYFHADTGQALRESFREQRNALIGEWFRWSNENVSTFFREQNDYVSESYALENEAVSKSYDEQNRLVSLTLDMEQIRKDIEWRKIRPLIKERARGIRNHVRSEFRAIRNEARETGRNLRNQVREEGRSERNELREQNRLERQSQ